MRGRWSASYGTVGAGLVVVQAIVAAPALIDVVSNILWLGATVSLAGRAAAEPPEHRRAWVWLAAGAGMFLVGGPVEQATRYLDGLDGLRLFVDVAYLLGFVLFGLGVRRLVRQRAPNGDPDGAIDGLIVAITVATLLGQALLGAPAAQAGVAAPAPVAMFVITLLAAAIVAFAVRLVFLGGRLPSAWLLLGASVTSLGSSAGTMVAAQRGEATNGEPLLVAGLMVSTLLLGLTAAHPSASRLGAPARAASRSVPYARLVVLGTALISGPVTIALGGVDHSLWWTVASPIVVTCLVMWRLVRLVAGRERAREVARDRERRQAVVARLGVLAVTELELDDLLREAAQAAREVLGVATAEISLVRDGTLAPTVVVGDDGPCTAATPLPPITVGDVLRQEHGRITAERPVAPGVRCHAGAGVGVPIGGGREPLGTLLAFPSAPCELGLDDLGFLSSLAAVIAGAAERRRAEDRLRHLALHDALTGLPNRTLLLDRLGQAVAGLHRRASPLGVLFVDLDGFKQVNDRLGHEAGDELLVQVADRLRRVVRDGEPCRLAGDEFVVLAADLPGRTAADEMGERIVAALAEPFELTAGGATIGCSVGVVVVEDADHDAEALLRAADAAMYQAKGLGRGRVVVHDPDQTPVSVP